jgi:acid stress-induced BolA-like protein IbaG/YrbA
MDILREIKVRIEAALPGARVEVSGGGGHFEIDVISERFAGQKTLARKRMVYGAIKELMDGDYAPLHAVDALLTRTPEEA